MKINDKQKKQKNVLKKNKSKKTEINSKFLDFPIDLKEAILKAEIDMRPIE